MNNTIFTRDQLDENDLIFLKDGMKCWLIELSQIKLFEIYQNSTRIYFDKFEPIIPRSLQYIEARINSKSFFRANRQQIINLKYIESIHPFINGLLKVKLAGSNIIEISRRQAVRFKKLMEI
jgi:two-component system LytT family response regulator